MKSSVGSSFRPLLPGCGLRVLDRIARPSTCSRRARCERRGARALASPRSKSARRAGSSDLSAGTDRGAPRSIERRRRPARRRSGPRRGRIAGAEVADEVLVEAWDLAARDGLVEGRDRGAARSIRRRVARVRVQARHGDRGRRREVLDGTGHRRARDDPVADRAAAIPDTTVRAPSEIRRRGATSARPGPAAGAFTGARAVRLSPVGPAAPNRRDPAASPSAGS